MITTTSSSDAAGIVAPRRASGLYFFLLRRNLGLMVLYFIVQFVFFPLQYIITAADHAYRGEAEAVGNLYGFGGVFTEISLLVFTGMTLLLPVLVTMLLFSFLHQKRTTDLFHALPVRREKLLLINVAAGATMLLAPMALNYLITLVAGLAFGLKNFSALGVAYDFIFTTAIVLTLLAVSTLVAVCTGTAFDCFIYNLGTLGALPCLMLLWAYFCHTMLYGFHLAPSIQRTLVSLSPLTLAVYMRIATMRQNFGGAREEEGFCMILALVWLALGAGILYLAVRVYRKRRSELAGRAGTDNALTRTLKICAGTAGGLCFWMITAATTQSESLLLRVASAAIGGALTYCLLECVMARGFKTLRRSVPFAACGLAIPAVFMLIMGTGGLGYESRLPELQDIQSVEIDFEDRYSFARIDLDKTRPLFTGTSTEELAARRIYYADTVRLREGESHAQVLDLNRALIEDHQQDRALVANISVQVTYHLDGGKKMARSYRGITWETAMKYNALNANNEVKEQTHPIFTLQAGDIQEVSLANRILTGITPAALTEDQTQQLIEALRADMRAETYADMNEQRVIGYVMLSPKHTDIFYEWEKIKQPGFSLPQGDIAFTDCYVVLTEGYTQTQELLGDYGYASFSQIDYSEIESVSALLDNYSGVDGLMAFSGPYGASTHPSTRRRGPYYQTSTYVDGTRYTDPAQIRALVELISHNRGESMVRLDYSQEDKKQFGSWNTSVCMMLVINTRDGNNFPLEFYVNPKRVSDALLNPQEALFNKNWRSGQEPSFFQSIVRKIREAPEIPGGVGELPAGQKPFLQFRF